MKTQKYTLKARARVGGKWRDKGEMVEVTTDQIKRLDAAVEQQEQLNKKEAGNG